GEKTQAKKRRRKNAGEKTQAKKRRRKNAGEKKRGRSRVKGLETSLDEGVTSRELKAYPGSRR
ncbi:hypothetical protein, partial [Burkholderia sp. WSM2232]|uniref:hypothetical protein n=1 Tax=Burkholderia sp. WSM2232 TaxID=944436 RepID=UPI001E2FD2A7